MILIRHYFPQIDIDSLSDEDFARISEDAAWLHSEMIIEHNVMGLGMAGSGPKQK